jgi:hypothetical protein
MVRDFHNYHYFIFHIILLITYYKMHDNLQEIYKIYMKKLEDYWEKMSKNKMYYKYKKFNSISHLSSIHIDFYHQPFKYMDKKNPEISFKNRVLKTFTKINKLKEKRLFLSSYVVFTMIKQCEYIISTPEYWIRFGYSQNIRNDIINTYKLFVSYMKDYLLYISNVPNVNKCIGIGKTIEGEQLLAFNLIYITGYDGVTIRNVQKFGLMRLVSIYDNIIKDYGSLDNAKNEYKKSLNLYVDKADLFADIKNNLYNIKKEIIEKELFSNDIILPKPDKIIVRSIPYLKAEYGPNARAFKDIMFINTNNFESIDKYSLLRMCVHETIPGHITRKMNTGKYAKKYITNKKIRKYVKKDSIMAKEGWSVYAQNMLSEITNNKLAILFDELLNAVRIIIDIGINSNNAIISFNQAEAIDFMQTYTILNNISIRNEILKYLAKPGNGCSYGLGDYSIKLLFNESKLSHKSFNTLFMKLPLTIPLFSELISHIK